MKYKSKGLLNDILKPEGRYEKKRVITIISLILAFIYPFTPLLNETFVVHEFVVAAMFTFIAAIVKFAVDDKKNINSFKDNNNDAT